MSEAAALPWTRTHPDRADRPAPHLLVIGLLAGLLLGSTLAGPAVSAAGRALAPAPTASERVWPQRALDRQWRSYATPVDVDRMFRSRR